MNTSDPRYNIVWSWVKDQTNDIDDHMYQLDIEDPFLLFFVKFPDNLKTPKFVVMNKSVHIIVAKIQWDGAWRKFVIEPSNDMKFDGGCWDAIGNLRQRVETMWKENESK
jgi:hypothetical protein